MLALLLTIGAAQALPEAPAVFCDTYPAAPACAAGTADCTVCHGETGPPAHNPYGLDLVAAFPGDPGDDFTGQLPAALAAIEDLDSDGDGRSNRDEIAVGTPPGFASAAEPECDPQPAGDNDGWAVGQYDPAFAYTRVMLDFCGRSPRYDERQAFAALSDPMAVVHQTLELCLDSPHWAEVLRELAVDAVEPIGPPTDANILGNWEWDLRLYAYAMSGERDAADVFLADYLVVEEPSGSGQLRAIDEPRSPLELYAQPLAAEHRYGMMTSRYSLAMRIMFSPVPRNLASHWYRKLLGLDIARSEGLYPVDELDGELPWPAPLDVDDKGVWQEACAACHSTLEAMSYPWARYNGIDLEGDTTGIHLEDRAAGLIPTTEGWLMGERVDGPEDWVAVAVASDAFSEHTVSTFWRRVFQRDPRSCELDEYTALWQGFRDGPRNVETMLHDLIDTDAYGVP